MGVVFGCKNERLIADVTHLCLTMEELQPTNPITHNAGTNMNKICSYINMQIYRHIYIYVFFKQAKWYRWGELEGRNRWFLWQFARRQACDPSNLLWGNVWEPTYILEGHRSMPQEQLDSIVGCSHTQFAQFVGWKVFRGPTDVFNLENGYPVLDSGWPSMISSPDSPWALPSIKSFCFSRYSWWPWELTG